MLSDLVDKLGGDMSELGRIKLSLLGQESEPTFENILNPQLRRPPKIALPEEFITLTEGLTRGLKCAERVAVYLLDERNIQLDPDTVYVCPEESQETKGWKDKAIFPVRMWGNVVGYTGRDVTGSGSRFLIKGPKSHMLFNYDIHTAYPTRPLFVVEGQLDALRIDGVALLGSRISDSQAEWLRQTNRKIVVVPDRRTGLKDNSGKILIERAVECGFSISTPDFGSCKDVDEAFVQYGHLYVIYQLLNNISSGETALVRGVAYCNR